jgi:uncharacterized integral membrane protein
MKFAAMLRNLWKYRRVIELALVVGVVLSFTVTNRVPVKVTFPFLGELDSTSGIVMLASAVLGAAACWLVMTFRQALREARDSRTWVERNNELHGGERRTGTEPEANKTEGLPSAGP